MTQMTGRVALVTGASRGIGRGIALELARRGAKIVVNYIGDPAEANEVVASVEGLGSEAVAIAADVTSEEAVAALVKGATDAFGTLDILVNNAGITRDNVIMMMKADDFDAVINTNLRSAWLCSRAAVKVMMRKRYGRIVNISSISGLHGQGGQTNYSASKAGLVGLTKALAKEVGPRNITVNAVAPGFVLTELTKNLPKELTDQMLPLIPLGRWANIEEIAYAVSFFASDHAACVTGQVLAVDGGMGM